MIRIMANVNCSTTSTLRGVTSAFAFLNVPFKTFTGRKGRKIKCGITAGNKTGK